ncbi:hypothetical protein [Arthrobacter sp. zg-Y877]|uniref:hypothetical protein n=1 Tax=Arthrobacter sp. zg-Y877 TaxID=3049074 RepID=UPI0025A42F40|nr:hypothetical protein [Arthrobacter sp. zg-Y877]MDM7988993.1 hypothetical protein [Arthrobacter sp. zg-Y877]
MSNNQQSPEPWQPPSTGQEGTPTQYQAPPAEQQYPAYPGAQQNPAQQYPAYPGAQQNQPYPGAQQYPAQQYPGAPATGLGYGVPPQPGRQTGKRITSMVFLVIGYVVGGLFLLAVPSVLPGVFADAETEGGAYLIGGIIGTFLFPVLSAGLVVAMHLWRRRIKQDELRKMKY